MYILNRSNFIDLKALTVYIDIDLTQSIKIAYKVHVTVLVYCFVLVPLALTSQING